MAPVIIDVQQSEDSRDVVHQAVQALAEGQLVAFPTETVYGLAASALNEDAVRRLSEVKASDSGQQLTLAIKSADDALDYVPDVSPLGERLARRCWPGPVTLVLDDSHPDSLSRQLPSSVQQAIRPDGAISLRVPAHDLILEVLRLSLGPLAITTANLPGQPNAVTAEDVAEQLGDNVSLILNDGKSKYGQTSSVVRVDGAECRVIREGVITPAILRRLSSFVVLVVCTGNTCRSPMGEILMKHRLAEKLGTTIDELEDRGVLVMSAGLAAGPGGSCTYEAQQAVKDRGLDLSNHSSQPLTERLLNYADLVLTMTRGHREAILSHFPAASPRTHLLCRDGMDVSDPIGGSQELYIRCADQIDQQLAGWVDSLDLESVIPPLDSGEKEQ